MKNKQEATHTPTPWREQEAEQVFSSDFLVGKLQGFTPIDHAFIVRAVNSHGALLDALKLAKRCMKENRGPSLDEFRRIQAAISQAEGN